MGIIRKLIISTAPILLLFSIAFADSSAKIGALLPMSGPFADLGEDCRKGIEISKKFFPKGIQIEFIYSDSKGEAKTGVSEFNRLLNQHNVSAFLIPRSSVGMPVNPLSKVKQIPILGAVGNSRFPKENPYAFQFWTTSEDEGELLAEHFKKTGVKKLAVLTAEDDWTVAVSDALVKKFMAENGNESINELVQLTETDLQATLSRLKSYQPEAIFINLGISQLATALKRIQELAIDSKLYSSFFFSKPEVLNALPKNIIEKVTFVEGKYNFEKFESVMQEFFPGQSKSFMTYSCYAASLFAAQALKQVSSPVDKKSIFEAMKEIKGIMLPDQTLGISDNITKFEIACKSYKEGVLKQEPC